MSQVLVRRFKILLGRVTIRLFLLPLGHDELEHVTMISILFLSLILCQWVERRDICLPFFVHSQFIGFFLSMAFFRHDGLRRTWRSLLFRAVAVATSSLHESILSLSNYSLPMTAFCASYCVDGRAAHRLVLVMYSVIVCQLLRVRSWWKWSMPTFIHHGHLLVLITSWNDNLPCMKYNLVSTRITFSYVPLTLVCLVFGSYPYCNDLLYPPVWRWEWVRNLFYLFVRSRVCRAMCMCHCFV